MDALRMTKQERESRAKIAKEITDIFGGLAPYVFVAKLVREGPKDGKKAIDYIKEGAK